MTKRTIILIILLSSVYNIIAQSWQDIDNAVRLSDNFNETQRQLTFYAENRDFCDYYVQISFATEGFEGMPRNAFLTIANGKQQIFKYKAREGAPRYSYRYTYTMYRGNSQKFPNIDFSYQLPVKDGDKVNSEIVENKFGYQLQFLVLNDTLYACRGGIICNDNLKDFSAKGHQTFHSRQNSSQITIYHADASFGEYVFNGKSLVYPGEIVEMGTPIAIFKKNSSFDDSVDDYDNDNEVNWMLFSTYFLDKNKVRDQSHGNKHTHFRPFFQTYNYGKTRLENQIDYLCQQTDVMFMQDMSRLQKRRYMQNKSK